MYKTDKQILTPAVDAQPCYWAVYSEYSGRWEVSDDLPADTAGRSAPGFSNYDRAELECKYRNRELNDLGGTV